MSNVGQIALTVVGTVVGAYFGNPELGFALGSLAGAALFPTQLPAGPRISDNRTTTASIGVPVTIGFGTFDVAGTVIWLAPYVEHANNSGGKGGPTQKLYSYTQSIAIGLCERPDDDAADNVGALAGVSRIWENGQLVFDIRPQLKQNTLIGQAAETDQNYAARLSVSAAYADTFTLHLGDQLQEADPTIEAVEGAGNVPGFRGLAYIVYPNRALLNTQGLRHPNFTFECYTSGLGECQDASLYSTDILYPWLANDGSEVPINVLNNHEFHVYGVDSHKAVNPPAGTSFTSLDVCKASLTGTGGYTNLQFMFYSVNDTEPPFIGGTNIVTWTPLEVTHQDPVTIKFAYNILRPGSDQFYTKAQSYNYSLYQASPPFHITSQVAPIGAYLGQLYKNQGVPYDNSGRPVDSAYGSGIGYSAVGATPGSPPFVAVDSLYDAVIQATRVQGKPLDPCTGLVPSVQFPDYAIDPTTGTLIKCGQWSAADATNADHTVSYSYKTLANFAQSGGFVTQYPVGPVLRSDNPNYSNQAFWESQYAQAVLAGKIGAGKTYPANYPVAPDHAWQIELQTCLGLGNSVPIADIIKAIAKRAGLTEAQVDVSDLTARTVTGYSISQVADGANCIAPLRSVGFFDCVESASQDGGVLRFPTRGKDVVATFAQDDFGCYDNTGNATTPAPAIETTRADETTLPRQIRLHYKSVERDYQDGEQDSPFRLTTAAVNDQDVSLAICLTDGQAVQCAEIIWSDAWAAQNSHTLSVDQSKFNIEVADAIAVPIDGVLQRLRITADSLSSFILRKLSCVRDDDAAYVSTAEAPASAFKAATIIIIGETATEYLDLPALQDADSYPGFYAAAQRAGGNGSWRGAILYNSVDGTTFNPLSSFAIEAVYGTLSAAAPVSPAFTWDTVTVLTVNLPENFSFESRTDDAVIAGANAAAMGADGRWEIVQFANAAKVSSTQWQLSRLLRGRRGTEHVLGSSQAGDAFVLVSGGDLLRVALNVAQLGSPIVYDNVTIGASFASGIKTTFAGHGEALVPFSPVRIAAHRDTSGDVLISWIRRDRLGHTLMESGTVPMSEASEAYQVDILEAHSSPATVLRTLSATSPLVIYTAAEQTADFGALPGIFDLAVYQMSAVVGRGTAGTGSFTVHVASDHSGASSGGGAPVHTAAVTFGGTFDPTAGVSLQIFFYPFSGSPISYTIHVTGSGKATLADFASGFAAQATTALGSHGSASAAGGVATLSSTLGHFNVTVSNDWLISSVFDYQDPGPTNTGVTEKSYFDLYTSAGYLSPTNDAAYGNAGSVTVPLIVQAYDVVEMTRITRLAQPAIPAGLEEGDRNLAGLPVNVTFSGLGMGNRYDQQMYGLAAALNASTALAPYLASASNGQYSGTSQLRSSVTLAFKPGYTAVLSIPSLGTPSGYNLKLNEVVPGAAVYSGTGRQAITAVRFDEAIDTDGTLRSDIKLGQVINVIVDGTTYSHTVDSTDMADSYTYLGQTTHYFDHIYADFQTQLQATGNYTVQLSKLYRVAGSTTPFTYQMVITRVTGNTAMTVSANSPFPLNVTVSYT